MVWFEICPPRFGTSAPMVGQHKSWDDVLLQEREENSRLRQQQRDQAERERRLSERLRQLSEQQQALAQDKTRTVDSVGRDGKIKALQVRNRAPAPDYRARAQLAVGCVALRARQCRAQGSCIRPHSAVPSRTDLLFAHRINWRI